MTPREPEIDVSFAPLRRAHQSERAPDALRRRALERARSTPLPRHRRKTRAGKWVTRGGLLALAAGVAGGLWLGVNRFAVGGLESSAGARSEMVPRAEPAGLRAEPAGPRAAAGRCPTPLPSPAWDPAHLELPKEAGFEAGVFEIATDCGPLTRRYVVRVPAGDASSAPVLIVLHDAGEYAEYAPIATRWWFEDVTLRERAVLVYGNAGTGTSTGAQGWENAGVWQTDETAHPAVDDVEYLRRVVDDLRARRGLAKSGEVFLAGYGSGAVMALTAAARHPERYSGVAAFLPTRPPRPQELGALARQTPAKRRLRSVFVVLPAVSAGKREDPSALAWKWAAALGSEPGRVGVTRQRPGLQRVDTSIDDDVSLRLLRLSAEVDPFPVPGGGDPITRAASAKHPSFFDGPGAAWAFFHPLSAGPIKQE